MSQPEIDIVIEGGTVVDGSGAPQRKADVAVSRERIVAVEPDLGDLAALERIDATGCTVTPGIIDIHSHADWTLTFDSAAESALLQGISTIVPGNCGHGVAPVGDSSLIRFCAFGDDRHTETEISWRSFGEWLARLRASEPAVNIARATVGRRTPCHAPAHRRGHGIGSGRAVIGARVPARADGHANRGPHVGRGGGRP